MKEHTVLCYNCKGDFDCLIEQLYHHTLNYDPYAEIPFAETFDNYHFFPQNW